MNKYMRNLTTAVLGATMAFSVMGTPLASASSKSEAKDYTQLEARQDYKHQYNKRPGKERPNYSHGSKYNHNKYNHKYNYNNYRVHANGVVTYEHNNYSIDENGKVYYQGGNYYGSQYTSPVYAAKAIAVNYGFNPNTAKFSLVSQGSNKALVKIVQSGQTYYANLVKNGAGYWYVTSMYR